MDNKPLIVRVLGGEVVERPPVWLMRQAGRYMEEYREVKSRFSFLEICRNSELAFEVSMQPIKAFDVDAAIVFADILLPLEGMGFEIDFRPGPVVSNPIASPSDLDRIAIGLGSVGDQVSQTVSLLSKELKTEGLPAEDQKAVIGFAGAPWTMACYAIERGPFKHFESAVIFARRYPEAMRDLLDKITKVTIDYLMQQYRAGADFVQLFDSWAGILAQDDYREICLSHLTTIVSALQDAGCPCVLFVGNGGHLLDVVREVGARAVSLDWRVSLSEARRRLGREVILQGNLDPSLLYLPSQSLRKRVREFLGEWPERSNLIVNLGHGVLQTTPPENVRVFVDEVKRGWGV